MPSIGLAIMCKDEESIIANCIENTRGVVDEIVVLDTGSTDNTIDIARFLGARVYRVNFSSYGSCRTVACHLLRTEWTLSLDADEIIHPDYHAQLRELVENPTFDAWTIPCRHWMDTERTRQVWKNIYPDYHLRLFRNKPEIQYIRDVHEVLVGYSNAGTCDTGIHIDHFGPGRKTEIQRRNRWEQYKEFMTNDRQYAHTFEGCVDVWSDPEQFYDWTETIWQRES